MVNSALKSTRISRLEKNENTPVRNDPRLLLRFRELSPEKKNANKPRAYGRDTISVQFKMHFEGDIFQSGLVVTPWK